MGKQRKNIPVRLKQRLEITVEGLASSGDGISRYQGYTLFLPGCVTEDRVLAEVTRITPRFGVLKMLEMLSASPFRVKPVCPVYGQCGGCQIQHLPYDKQGEFKVRVLTDSLARIGKLDFLDSPSLVSAPNALHYRNKGIFALEKKGENFKVGFFTRGSHSVVDLQDCPVMFDPINTIYREVRRIIEKHHPSIYNEFTHKGFLRNFVIKGSLQKKEFLVGLVTTAGQVKKKMVEEIANINRKSTGEFKIAGIVQNINLKRGNIIFGEKNETLWGRNYYNETIGSVRYRPSLTSFSQINPLQAHNLYGIIEDMLSGEKRSILDAYCGIGSIALRLARSGKKVVGVEEHQDAVKDAEKSAKENGVNSCTFFTETVEEFMRNHENEEFPVVILNPPRKGCSEEVLEALLEMRPEKIIYVSCKPSTLARDLQKLCEGGYKVRDIKVVDMFPQTVHMETVVELEIV